MRQHDGQRPTRVQHRSITIVGQPMAWKVGAARVVLTPHAAQVVAAPPKRTAAGQASAPGRADEAAFLAGIAEDSYRSAVKDVLAGCSALGLEVKWRSVGASIRFQTPDRRQPLSIGWLLPKNSHGQGPRFVTFGVDPASLKQTPSVNDAVQRFTERLRNIAGSRAAPTKLDAYTFTPEVLPTVSQQVVADGLVGGLDRAAFLRTRPRLIGRLWAC